MRIKTLSRYYNWFGAWLDLLAAIVFIISFTFIYPQFNYKYMFWASKRCLKYKKRGTTHSKEL